MARWTAMGQVGMRLSVEERIRRLRDRLARPLPGPSAQWEMAPPYRRSLLAQRNEERGHARAAAVLILLYPNGLDLAFPLTLRTHHVAYHKGQISLPGGACEPGESAVGAALREAEEELGPLEGPVEILGSLTPLFVPPSGFMVHPVVGYLPKRPSFRPAPMEVAEVLEATLSWLLDPCYQEEEEREVDGVRWRIPVFRLGSYGIWGATAMILAEFRAVVREAMASTGDPGARPEAESPSSGPSIPPASF